MYNELNLIISLDSNSLLEYKLKKLNILFIYMSKSNICRRSDLVKI